MARDKRYEDLVARIKESRGYILDFQELLAEYDPDFLERYDELFMGMFKSNHLPEKYKHLIWCATGACMLNEVSLEMHTRKALEAGATPNELIEALEAAFFHGGVPVWLYAAKYVKAAIESMKSMKNDPK